VNASTVPDSTLQRLPGWAGATCELLHGGLSNQTWLLEKDGRCAVLKIDDEPREPPLNTREQEAIIQTAAADVGLASGVLFAADGLYLTDYAKGDVWSAASVADDDNLELLADVLRRVHTLPCTGREFGALPAAKRYADAIDVDDALVALCIGLIEAVGSPRRCRLCHNDLVAENILATPAIRLLDWEYACDNEPLFDLATVVEHHELDERQAAHLLDAYFDGDGERHLGALREQRRLYCALLWLWLAARPETTEQDLQHAAGRLTTSCS
jgi:thiamine kinase-like enzyme